MSDTESLDYLQVGFDPASLTVPRLRSILVSHSIPYPSGAKKPQLIEIFTENVLPQSRKILSARARARRTSKGITDAESQDSTIAGDDELMPPPPTPRARSAKKPSWKVKTDESESDTPSARSPTKTTRKSNKHTRTSDTDTTGTEADGTKKSARKSRKSQAVDAPSPVPAPAPRVKLEDFDDSSSSSRRESAFTSDNPFQSGSSPPPGVRSPSGERKRKSLGPSASKDLAGRKSSSTTRRPTDTAKAEDGIRPPTSATFEIPVSELNGLQDVDQNGVEAGEEFTPEEQLELKRERAANGPNALDPRRPRRQQPHGIRKKGPILVGLLTLLSGYAAWYRQEKVAIGYCGVGRDANSIIPDGVQVPPWIRILAEPQCEPCPPHAYCSADLETICEPDFVLKPHPLSFGGLVPFLPTCEPDGEKVRKVKAVADRAVEELRERRAKFECGDLTDASGSPKPTVEIAADELKREVSRKRRRGMGETEFEDLWAGAIGEIKARDEVVSGVDGFAVPPTETEHSSQVPHSPDSPSAVPSDDPSDSLWHDIASKLLL